MWSSPLAATDNHLMSAIVTRLLDVLVGGHLYARMSTAWPPATAHRAERPGIGLAIVGLGVLLEFLCYFALPWASAGGLSVTFSDIREALASGRQGSGVSWAGRQYVGWVGLTTFGLLTVVAVPAVVGFNSGVTTVFRTLGVVAAAGAAFVHYVGVWQLFYGQSAGTQEAGIWLVYLADALILVGAAIGPRRRGLAPAWGPPPPWPPAPPTSPGSHTGPWPPPPAPPPPRLPPPRDPMPPRGPLPPDAWEERSAR